MNTVKIYLAKNLWGGGGERAEEITLYVRIYGLVRGEMRGRTWWSWQARRACKQ